MHVYGIYKEDYYIVHNFKLNSVIEKKIQFYQTLLRWAAKPKSCLLMSVMIKLNVAALDETLDVVIE